ncbi:YcgL domain-containing protein [Haliea sp. E1-2-M8]|uniref:YcgL domain-containing protein n=1 Tax=Haliea sp. E1-2-M8 TaxID=3064706 RepID=UPI00271EC330|nr:YcgL domain-containing protein [Haliea sp. E1-2-M8]MDO8862424.1 YcgL domain-containing protein [Haliea sp. E1-2-M8]
MRRICQIFRSPRKPEMYLYVDKADGLLQVPETLLAQFGEPHPVMVLALDASRKLARVQAAEVLAKIDSQGFFLQMPPTDAELLRREGERAQNRADD